MDKFPNFLILKVGNLVSKTYQNPQQFFPSIIKQIKQGRVNVKMCKRDLLASTDYANIVTSLLLNKKTGRLKICSPNPPFVLDIVQEIENHLGVCAVKQIIPCDEQDLYKPDIPTVNYQEVIRRYFQ